MVVKVCWDNMTSALGGCGCDGKSVQLQLDCASAAAAHSPQRQQIAFSVLTCAVCAVLCLWCLEDLKQHIRHVSHNEAGAQQHGAGRTTQGAHGGVQVRRGFVYLCVRGRGARHRMGCCCCGCCAHMYRWR